MLLAIGVRAPVSKSRTVLSDTLARLASLVCDHPNQPRAARLCSGLMPGGYRKFLWVDTKIVYLHSISGYCVRRQFLVTRDPLPQHVSRKEPEHRSGSASVG